MSMKKEREGGFAIVTAISFMVVVGVLVSTALLLGYSNKIRSSETVFTTQAQTTAEAGVDYALKKIYTDVLASKSVQDRSYIVYKKFLNDKVFSVADGLAVGSSTKLLDKGKVTFTNTVGGQPFTTIVSRNDFDDKDPPQILLTIKSNGDVLRPDKTQVARRVLDQTIFISPANPTYDFALLANNVNCTFCHTRIESMKSAYTGVPAGTDRVRVGTLQELEIRMAGLANDFDWTDTVIGGTLYTRGRFLNQFRNDITLPGTDFLNYTIDQTAPTDGLPAKIQDGNLNKLKLQNCNNPGECKALNNFYTNYPSSGGIDGILPGNFPLPVNDVDADKVIDDTEWQNDIAFNYTRAANTYGTIAPINAGTLQLAPMTWSLSSTKTDNNTNQNSDYVAVPSNPVPFANLSAASIPLLANTLASPLTSGPNGIQGNLIVKGNFNISGIVYVNGDLVISGQVYGKGRIITRGNIYVTGDIEYLCSPTGTLCAANDFKALDAKAVKDKTDTFPSLLGLLAGGNLMVGDYLSLSGLGSGSSQAHLLNSTQRANWSDSSLNFAYAEVANFNRSQNALANTPSLCGTPTSTYRPRFYLFDAADTQVRYTTNPVAELPGNDGATTKLAFNSPCVQQGVIVSLSPTANWITPNVIKQEWINNVELQTATRPKYTLPFDLVNNYPTCTKLQVYSCVYKPLKIDATLYSANATIAMVRGTTNNDGNGSFNGQNSNANRTPGSRSITDGRMIINGSLVSADMGVFSPGSEGKHELWTSVVSGGKQRAPGIIINYDPRSRDFLNKKGAGLLSNPLRSYFSLAKDQ